MAARHQRWLVAHGVRRREREHQRQMEAAFKELGDRFVRWAHRNGYEPAKYARLGLGWHKLGRGWQIGDLGTAVTSSGLGGMYALKRDHALWFVLADGTVTTIADVGVRRLGAEGDTKRFIEVVRTNWGCDLNEEPPVTQPARGNPRRVGKRVR
jgi:hypothetical protein